MKVPAICYGYSRDVKAASRKVISALAKGAALYRAFSGEMIDTNSRKGLLVLSGDGPLLREQPHYYIYLPIFLIDQATGKKADLSFRQRELFDSALLSDWGVLSLMGDYTIFLARPENRDDPYLAALLKFWHAFPKEGRYSVGSPYGKDLWALPTRLRTILALKGVPMEILNAPLPPEGPAALLKYVQVR